MRADFSASGDGRRSAADRLDPRLKLIFTLVFVVGIVLTPVRWWPLYLAEGGVILLAYAATGQPWRLLATRLAVMLPFLVLIATSVVLARALQTGWGLAIQILARALLSLSAMVTLVASTPFPKILVAMAQLRVPSIFLSILAFMYRYLFVLLDELARMRRARLARTFEQRSRTELLVVANFTGILFVRAFERAERVYAAMCARGWDGTVRYLDRDE